MHCGGHLRDAFCQWLDDGMPPDIEMDVCFGGFNNPAARWESQTWPSEKLLGRLCHCTDIMPGDVCAQLELEPGSTYARAAQRLIRQRKLDALLAHVATD